MQFDSRFALEQIVQYQGVLYTVHAVKFSMSKVWYDLEHSNGGITQNIDSCDVEDPTEAEK